MLTTTFNTTPSAGPAHTHDTPPAPAPVAAPASAVAARRLSRTIDDRTILADLTFDLPCGRFLALLGANGAGKSTLLKILAGLMEPSQGTLCIFGHDRQQHGGRSASHSIGLIGHTPMLYRDLSARENLLFFARLHRLANPGRRADELLESVGLAHRAHDAVKTFSRGMVQRTAIARALLTDPDLLLADEPFAGLDAPSRDGLESMLAVLHAQGKTIVLTNHDIPQSLALAQDVMVLRRGRLALAGDASALSPRDVLDTIDCGGTA